MHTGYTILNQPGIGRRANNISGKSDPVIYIMKDLV